MVASPGVQVKQKIRSSSPTITTPTLGSCQVGVCRQIVNAVEGGALNSGALLALPGGFISSSGVGDPAVYAGLNGLVLAFTVKNSAVVTVTFAGASLSPASVVQQVNDALDAAGITEAYAQTLGTTSWRLRTVGTSAFDMIEIDSTTDAQVASAFGITTGHVYSGRSIYDQYSMRIGARSYPDPRNNIDYLDFDLATVKAYLSLGSGSGLRELSRTTSFLRNGGTNTAAIATGNVDIAALSYSTPASRTGTVDITAGGLYGPGGTLHGTTLIMAIDGGSDITLTFNGNANSATEAAMLAAIAAAFGIDAVQGGGGGNKLVLTTPEAGASRSIAINATSTADTILGVSGTGTGSDGVVTNGTLLLDATDANGTLASYTVTFNYPASSVELLAQINDATVGSVVTATLAPSTNYLVLTTGLISGDAAVNITGGTARATLGLAVANHAGASGVAAVDDGDGDAVTPVLSFNGANFSTAAAVASVSGNVALAGLTYPSGVNGKTIELSDGGPSQILTLPGTISDSTELVNALQDFFPGLTFDINATFLRIRSLTKGDEGVVKVIGGTLLTTVGLTAGTYRGTPFPPLPGDDIYVDGALYGRILQVAPAGNATLKITKEVAVDPSVGATWYIVANGLSGAQTATRPSADLIVDGNGTVTIKGDLLRDSTGTPNSPALSTVYLAYKAVRKDVTARAENPVLLQFSSVDEIEAQVGPISSDNPLALALYCAKIAAGNNRVYGIGVDEATADAPYGTVEAYARAYEFLEARRVYAITPLTNDETVATLTATHVAAMSEPEQKGERITFFNPAEPTAAPDTLVASGAGSSTVATTFDTGVQNLTQLLLEAGVNPVGTIAADTGLFIDIASNALRYSISQVSGGVVTIRTSFSPGENDDDFYTTTDFNDPPLGASLVNEVFAIKVRGAALTNTDGTPDKAGKAAAYAAFAQGFGSRRVRSVVARSCVITLNGIDQILPGFYVCSALSGLVSRMPPQQSLTNIPIPGIKRVSGTGDYFKPGDLQTIQDGGNWIVVQDDSTPSDSSVSGPPYTRFALTTDMSTLENRTDSITTALDWFSYLVRDAARAYIGRFNITQGLLDTLSQVLHGLAQFAVDNGVFVDAIPRRILQDEDALDTVLADFEIDPAYPCNNIIASLLI